MIITTRTSRRAPGTSSVAQAPWAAGPSTTPSATSDATVNPPVLQARGLSRTYDGRLAVEGVDIDIRRGALTALIGPNGAGKSTIISMLIGLLRPTAGTVRAPAGNPRIGVVFQNSVLDPTLTVRENLEFRARLDRHVPRTRTDEVIDLVKAGGFSGQRYGTLSGGQRRRVDIARALLPHPDLLVLDEPTTGLDIGTRRMLWSLLHGLRRNEGLSILLTTHYLEEARNADAVVVLDGGRVIERGTAAGLIRRYGGHAVMLIPKPGHEEDVARLVADDPRWAGRVRPTGDRRRASPTPEDSDVNGGPDAPNGPLEVALDGPQDCLVLLDAARGLLEDFEVRRGTMDDAFLAITGRASQPHGVESGSVR